MLRKVWNLTVVFWLLIGVLPSAIANNSSYIAISNSIAKQKHLEVVSNNAANVNTTGFEQDNIVFEQRNHKETKRKTDAFVVTKGNYQTNQVGPLKPTGRSLDMAIVGNAYFMVITPAGPRYTLDGAAMIDSTNTLVNHNGYPYSSKDGQPIIFPDIFKTMQILSDGTIYADIDEVGIVGMFGFPNNTQFTKEGDNKYITDRQGVPIDDGTVQLASGYLRGSNVSSTKILTEVIDLQRSSDTSNELVKNIGTLERNMVTRIMKPN